MSTVLKQQINETIHYYVRILIFKITFWISVQPYRSGGRCLIEIDYIILNISMKITVCTVLLVSILIYNKKNIWVKCNSFNKNSENSTNDDARL